MTEPARSTTPVVTDPSRARRIPLAVTLLGVVAVAAAAILTITDARVPGSHSAETASAPLIVGDGRTVTLISLGAPETDAVLTRVSGDIGSAVAAVEGFWGTDWTHEIVIVATGSADQFAAQAGGDQRGDTAALAVADKLDVAKRTATGQRIVLAPGAGSIDTEDLRIVLGHELFHYAARAGTAPDAPRWLTEGVADYVARPSADEVTAISGIGLPAALPADVDLTGDPEQLSVAYDRAWLFARYIADRYGAPTLRALYERACGAGHSEVPEAFRQILGATPEETLGDWRRWLEERTVRHTGPSG